MPVVVKTRPVPAQGVGRIDYSMNVEKSVEPLIRSWQDEYQYYKLLPVPVGASVTEEIPIVTDTVVIVYDYFLSAPVNVLLHLLGEFFTTTGVWAPFIAKSGYQCVELHLARGFPMFRKWRVTVTNYGLVDADCPFSAHGIVTAEREYYGTWTAP